jgi:histone acetyltransferase (RNA polymerase elongator complex component)
MKRQTIYPIFLPHSGCPFQCIYCNQLAVTRAASGDSLPARFRAQLAPLLESARTSHVSGEVALYGGTFTALPRADLQEILEFLTEPIHDGVLTGIRFSTRPDCLTPEICSFLAKYPVRTVELGVQSFSDAVLHESRRGYTRAAVLEASTLVREYGWDLGLQLMMGLPGDTERRFRNSIAQTVALQPDLVRIYPTLVFADTKLAQWHARGDYRPLTLEEAIAWGTAAYDALLQAEIPIARMGLHADPELQKPGTIVAGPYHPAFGHLVRSRWWRDRISRALRALTGAEKGGRVNVRVSGQSLGDVLGQKRGNLIWWRNEFQLEQIRVQGEKDWRWDRFHCAAV